jgi:hypothetical protein
VKSHWTSVIADDTDTQQPQYASQSSVRNPVEIKLQQLPSSTFFAKPHLLVFAATINNFTIRKFHSSDFAGEFLVAKGLDYTILLRPIRGGDFIPKDDLLVSFFAGPHLT